MSGAICFNLDPYKMLSSGNGLTKFKASEDNREKMSEPAILKDTF